MTDSVSSTSTTTTTTRTSYSQNRNDFDTDALVEDAVAAKMARADSYETRLSGNEVKISAYQDMQDKLQSLLDTLEVLRGPSGSSGASSDVFQDRATYLTSASSTDVDTLLSATVQEGTDIGSHEIEILQVAKADKLGGGSIASRTDDLGWSGTFTLGTSDVTDGGNATSATVTIAATMSLGDIADAINAETSSTGVTASIIKVAEGDYMLVLTGSETARSIQASAGSGDDVLSNLGITATDDSFANRLQSAQTARLKVDGVTIERNGNDIDDAVDGVSLYLYKAEAGTTVTVEVDNDLSSIKEAIEAFVEAYNTFRDFVLTNQTTETDGTASADAVLFGDSTLRSTSAQLQDIVSEGVDDHALAGIGITFDEDNKLVIDDDALDDALLGNIDVVETLFAYRMETSSGDLKLLTHGTGSLDFTLDVTVNADGTLTGAGIGGDSSMFTISGSTIIGAAGTAYEGLRLVYTGNTSKSVTVSITAGLAEQLYNATTGVADENDGQLADLISSLRDSNEALQEKITRIEVDGEIYRNYLLDRYSRIEAKLAEAQSTLDLLEALNNSDNS